MNNKSELSRGLGVWTAVFAVFASMIGSGIFGNTGIIQMFVGDPLTVVGLWLLYGLVAMAGALSYAELAARFPHPGGEYVYLREVIGKLPSFLTGWVSFLVGFSAPAAAAAILSADYAESLLKVMAPNSSLTILFASLMAKKIYASVLVLLFSLVHILGTRGGGIVQNILTSLKLAIIVGFVLGGFFMVFQGQDVEVGFRQAFAPRPVNTEKLGLGLLFVLFAYSGWNGASYLAGEIKNPGKNVPRALFWGTLITTGIYLLINVLYYLAVPLKDLTGNRTIAALAARNLFGEDVSIIFNAAFCLILLSTLSAVIMIGPRVYYAMARDGLFPAAAGHINKKLGTPVVAILAQSSLSIIYIQSGTYNDIMIYMGFALSIFPVLTMVALIKQRLKGDNPEGTYRTKFFPLIPVFFILISFFIMCDSLINSPKNCFIAIGGVLLGIPIYYLLPTFQKIYVALANALQKIWKPTQKH